MEDEQRNEVLQLTPRQMADVAEFCNSYPNIEVEYKITDEDGLETGDAVQMVVTLERETDDDDEEEEEDAPKKKSVVAYQVKAPRFPKTKTEGWWLVIGDSKRNSLLCIKRVALLEKTKVRLDFVAPDEAGDYSLTLYLMCDSYLGCDQEYEFKLSVAQGASDDDSDDSMED